MRTVRRSSHSQGIRMKNVATYYVESNIRTAEVQRICRHLLSKGVEFAKGEDCDATVLKIACDRAVNGRTLAVVSRGF